MEHLTLCYVGWEQSGKTGLIIRGLFDEFESTYAPTLEDSFTHNTFVHGYKEYQVDILDISGSDIYQSEYDRWFAEADAFVYVYNIQEEESYFNLRTFRDEIQRVKKARGINMRQIPSVLVGTHLDCERKVSESMGKKMADALGCPFFETSSKVDDAQKLASQTHYWASPKEIILHILAEKARESIWKQLDELKLPEAPQPKQAEKSKKRTNTASKAPAPVPMQMEMPTQALLAELAEKWGRPVDKLPVYIDFPRLATKVVIVVGPMQKLPVTAIDKSRIVAISSPSVAAKKIEMSSSPTKTDLMTSVKKMERSRVDDRLNKATKKDKKLKEEKQKKEKKDKEKKKKKGPVDPALVESFKVGQRVKFPDYPEYGIGTIKFKGPVKGTGIKIGVELDKPVGKHNGSYKGVAYFTCPDNCGVLVDPDELLPNFVIIPLTSYTGGYIKTNFGEQWHYDQSGILKCNDVHNGKQLTYEWTGEYLKPGTDMPSFGGGHWNGETILWFKKDWLIFRMNAREETIKYIWDDTQRAYKPTPMKTKEVLPMWSWKKNTLVSSLSEAQWTIDSPTKVPEHIVIMLQCLRYIRFGFVKPDEPVVINSEGMNVKEMWATSIDLNQKVVDVRINPEMTVLDIIQSYQPSETKDSTFRIKGSNTYLDQGAKLRNYPEVNQPKAILELVKKPAPAPKMLPSEAIDDFLNELSQELSNAGLLDDSSSNFPLETPASITETKQPESQEPIKEEVATKPEEPVKEEVVTETKPEEQPVLSLLSSAEVDNLKRTLSEDFSSSNESDTETQLSAIRPRSDSTDSTDSNASTISTSTADYASDSEIHLGARTTHALNINEIEILPDEPTLSINVIIKNWTLKVTVPERATVEQLKREVSRRATKKMAAIEDKLQKGRVAINSQLDVLFEAISAGQNDVATATVKQIVEAMNKRIDEGEVIAGILTEEEEDNLLSFCDEMRDIPKLLLKSTIDAIKRPSQETHQQLKLDIDVTKKYSANISIGEPRTECKRLLTDEEEPVELNSSAIVGAMLTDDTTLLAELEDAETIKKILAEEEEERKRQEEIERKRREEEEKIRQIRLAEEKKKQMETEEALEKEQQEKWNDLFASLENTMTEIRTRKETVIEPQVQEAPKQAPAPAPAPAPTPEPAPVQAPTPTPVTPESPVEVGPSKATTQETPQSPPTSPSETQGGEKKPFIGDVMREVLCDLAEKLGEKDQIPIIRKEFDVFVKQGGDTSRQLAKFLQHVLKPDSRVCKILKAVNQSIIASPFIRLKYAFQKIPFEDVSGKWKIIVHIVPMEEVWVIHQKSGASKEGPPNSGYEINWELRMKFNWELTTLLEAPLIMKGATYQHGINEHARKEIQHIVDTFQCK